MKYYIAEGPLKEFNSKWLVSYYKINTTGFANIIRIWPNGTITKDDWYVNPAFLEKYCKEITEEEYNLMLEL